MNKIFSVCLIVFLVLVTASCSHKTAPAKTPEPAPEVKVVTRKTVKKTPVPKSIVVNDKAATRSVEGRYYYDLEGRRYWRNRRDGKYYLYYKGMFENKDFQ
jgi:hypothetical protein